MRFLDREAAGRQFAAKLTHLKDAQPVKGTDFLQHRARGGTMRSGSPFPRSDILCSLIRKTQRLELTQVVPQSNRAFAGAAPGSHLRRCV